MKMSKYFLFFLTFVLIIMNLSGCSKQEQAANVTWENITESKAEDSQTGSTESKPEKQEFIEEEKPIVFFPLQPSIEETVLYDKDQIRIIAKDITYSKRSADISLVFENMTSKNLSFYSNTLAYNCNSINGHMFSFGYVNEDVAAGQTVETKVSISGSELVLYGITDIADIELAFRIKDDDNEILTGPCSIKTSLADTYDYSTVSLANGISDQRVQNEYGYSIISISDTKIYDSLGLSISSELVLESKDGEKLIALEVSNSGNELKYLSLGNISINGLTIEQSTWTTLAISPGKTGTLDFVVDGPVEESIRELVGTPTVSKVTFDLTQKDSEYDALEDPASISLQLPGDEKCNEGIEIYRSENIVVYQVGVVPDEWEKSDDYYIALIYENLTDDELEIHYPKDGFRINDSSEASASTYTTYIPGNTKVLEDIKVRGSSFEDVGISSWEEVATIALDIEVKLDYKTTLDEVTLNFDPTLSNITQE